MSESPTIVSPSRMALLRRCPRRFFYRYIHAAHSLDESAAPERKQVRELSHAVGLPLFFRQIVKQGLRRALCGESWPESLYGEYRSAMRSQLDSHCRLPLREWHSGECELPKLRRTLRAALKRFQNSPAARMLLRTPPERMHLFEEPASVCVGNFLWFSAPFCRRRIGRYWEFFEFSRSDFPLRSLFHRDWAMQNHLPLEHVRSFFIAPDGSVSRFTEALEVTSMLDSLRHCAAQMEEFACCAGPDAVPCTADSATCSGCPYESICSKSSIIIVGGRDGVETDFFGNFSRF